MAESNKRRISMREGKVYLDGLMVMDAVKATAKFTPDVSESRGLGERTPSSRWVGGKISVTIEEFMATPWLSQIIKGYIKSGKTPVMTVQAIENDTGSEYYENYGSNVVTATGCVPTGDLTLLDIDAGGDLRKQSITFSAKEIA